jgi:uncharacterized protein YbcI
MKKKIGNKNEEISNLEKKYEKSKIEKRNKSIVIAKQESVIQELKLQLRQKD